MKTLFLIFFCLGTLYCKDEEHEPYFDDFADAKKKLKGLKCGKDDPSGKNDCIKYGTDSDFYCCYFESPDKKSDNFCGLVSYEAAGKSQGNQKYKLYKNSEKLVICGSMYYQLPLLIFALCVFFLL